MCTQSPTIATDVLVAGRYCVLGIPISAVNLEAAAESLERWCLDKVGRFVCVCSVHGVILAQDDPHLRRLFYDAAMVVPDGMPLVWVGKLAGYDVERTCGPDLMEIVFGRSAKTGVKHFLYGGKEGVAETLKCALERKFPGVSIVGLETPPFRPLAPAEIESLAQRIQESGADVVWIGLSTPKQEILMGALAKMVSTTLIGVGAAFDVHAGLTTRAPRWLQSIGLEWSFRLFSEPRRLWRRYLSIVPRFIWLVALERLRGK